MGAAMRREGMGRGTSSPSGLNDLISPALMAEGLPVLPPWSHPQTPRLWPRLCRPPPTPLKVLLL